MKQLSLFVLLFGFHLAAFSQITKESTKVDFIKSIHFSGGDQLQQIPIIRLNESFTLLFDDLLAQDSDYYYRIKYFNHDWTPSDLFQNQYLAGFDNQRIDNFSSSFGTLQRYNHYKLTLPNETTQFKVSGNYMIEVYNRYDELMFSRKFLIYEDKAQVQLGVYPTQKVERLLTHQNLQFTINPLFAIRNPQNDLKVVLLQNDQWNSSKSLPLHNTTAGIVLFIGMKKQLNLKEGMNTSTLTQKTLGQLHLILVMSIKENYMNTISTLMLLEKTSPTHIIPILTEISLIQTLQGSDPHIESDYTEVYFSLAKQYELKEEEIYIYGKFNNYALTQENKMIYNPSLEVYEGILF